MDRREALKKAACSVAVIAAPAVAIADPNEGSDAGGGRIVS